MCGPPTSGRCRDHRKPHRTPRTSSAARQHVREPGTRRARAFPGDRMLRFTTAGESHGPALVSILEGVPAGLQPRAEQVDGELARRQQGYGRGRRMQIERDAVEFLSGVRAGETIGSPIAMLIRNRDWDNWREIMDPAPRPE